MVPTELPCRQAGSVTKSLIWVEPDPNAAQSSDAEGAELKPRSRARMGAHRQPPQASAYEGADPPMSQLRAKELLELVLAQQRPETKEVEGDGTWIWPFSLEIGPALLGTALGQRIWAPGPEPLCI